MKEKPRQEEKKEDTHPHILILNLSFLAMPGLLAKPHHKDVLPWELKDLWGGFALPVLKVSIYIGCKIKNRKEKCIESQAKGSPCVESNPQSKENYSSEAGSRFSLRMPQWLKPNPS